MPNDFWHKRFSFQYISSYQNFYYFLVSNLQLMIASIISLLHKMYYIIFMYQFYKIQQVIMICYLWVILCNYWQVIQSSIYPGSETKLIDPHIWHFVFHILSWNLFLKTDKRFNTSWTIVYVKSVSATFALAIH